MASTIWLTQPDLVEGYNVDEYDPSGTKTDTFYSNTIALETLVASNGILVWVSSETLEFDTLNVRINKSTTSFDIVTLTELTVGTTPVIDDVKTHVLTNGSIILTGKLEDLSIDVFYGFLLESEDGINWTQKAADPEAFWGIAPGIIDVLYDTANTMYYFYLDEGGGEVTATTIQQTVDFLSFYDLVIPDEPEELMLFSPLLIDSNLYCALSNTPWGANDVNKVLLYINGVYNSTINLSGWLSPGYTYPEDYGDGFRSLIYDFDGTFGIVVPEENETDSYVGEAFFKYSAGTFSREKTFSVQSGQCALDPITDYITRFTPADARYMIYFTRKYADSTGGVCAGQLRYQYEEGLWTQNWDEIRLYKGSSYFAINQELFDPDYSETATINFIPSTCFWVERIRCLETC